MGCEYVCPTCVGRALDGVEAEVDAERGTERDQLTLCIGETIDVTEPLAHVFGAITALLWQRRIQFERQPRDLFDGAGACGERLLEACVSDVTPRANDIGKNFELHDGSTSDDPRGMVPG